jgi:polyisoprenoid-binding protein YceI
MIRVILIILFLGTLTAQAQQYSTEKGQVRFLSKASLNEFTGESKSLKGLIDLEKNLVDFFLDLNTLKTGISLRDKHMRENYLETGKYPFAEFTGKLETAPSFTTTFQNVRVKGIFKIHGIEKEVVIVGEIRMLPTEHLELKAQWVISLEDYNIDIPKLVFYELATEQKVSIDVILIPKK